MKKLFFKFTAYLVLSFTLVFALGGCFQKPPLVIKESDTYIVITVSDEQMSLSNDTTLVAYMQSLKEDGQLEFELQNGMITSINGIENAADWSNCWMLYTSDADNANTALGTVEYQLSVYGSSMYGAEELKIKDGYLYIWVYQSMSW